MIGILLGIAAVIALGIIIAKVVMLTMKWLVNKVKEKLHKRNTTKVAAMDINKMIEECDNQISLDEFEKLADEGATHLLASVDNEGNVQDVEAIEAENEEMGVSEYLDRTGEGMIVING